MSSSNNACEEVSLIDLHREKIALKEELRVLMGKHERLELRYKRLNDCFEMLKMQYDEQKKENAEMKTLQEYTKGSCEGFALPAVLTPYAKGLIEEVRVFLTFTSFKQFYDEISEHIIGQEEGLSLLLTGIYRYLCGIAKEGKPRKANMMLVAPSGCGKTETLRVLKRYFEKKIKKLVIIHEDLSNVTAAGYKGRESLNLLVGLARSEGYGLAFFSEIDKLMAPHHSASGENTSLAVINEMLCILEGQKYPVQNGAIIDTSLTMFICDGSFNEIRANKKNESEKTVVGFLPDNKKDYDSYEEITKEDIIDFGCTYELLGRFASIIQFHTLSRESLLAVVEKSRSKISETLGIELWLGEDFVQNLIDKGNGDYGCRLLESTIYNDALCALRDVLMQGIGDSITITLHNGGYEIKEIEEEKATGEVENTQED